jgi:hypothetical protein
MTSRVEQPKANDADSNDDYEESESSDYYETMPTCPHYHPNSELRKKPGLTVTIVTSYIAKFLIVPTLQDATRIFPRNS